MKFLKKKVSVPIRGLFNLTQYIKTLNERGNYHVSVPIRGLFNLTRSIMARTVTTKLELFPSPSGDYLI